MYFGRVINESNALVIYSNLSLLFGTSLVYFRVILIIS
jgi:hypothetical protein